MSAEPGDLKPDFESVQAHYDRPQDFYFLFLDRRTRSKDGVDWRVPTYSCGYFPTGQESLEEAQEAKIDLSLGKLDLEPGQRLLDIGFGWASVAFRAHDHYDLLVTGLTLSKNQHQYAQEAASGEDGLEFLLEGWETHQPETPYDGIVSIGAFEHFGRDKYPGFFKKANEMLVPGGRMLLHTITFGSEPKDRIRFARYARFIDKEIFPAGQLPYPEQVEAESEKAGFNLLSIQELRPHYPRTLRPWAQNLEDNREAAVAVIDERTCDIYMKYLLESANWFESGEISVRQFLLQRPS